MNQFFTWGTLATLAGASIAVGLLTQFLKDTIKIPTQWLSYILAVIILAAATFFTGVTDVSLWALIPLNAVIVSTSANGAYAAILRAKNGKADSGDSSVPQYTGQTVETVEETAAKDAAQTGAATAVEVKNDTALSSDNTKTA